MDYLIRNRLVVGDSIVFRRRDGKWENRDVRNVLPAEVREDLHNRTIEVGPRKLKSCSCGNNLVFFQSGDGIKVGCHGSCRPRYCCPNCSDREVYEEDHNDLGARSWDIEYVRFVNKKCPLCGYRFY